MSMNDEVDKIIRTSSIEDQTAELRACLEAAYTAGLTEGIGAPALSVKEIHYLARCVDLGRSDPEASSILAPDERDTLLRKLGGRRN
jgi:hypothetical protein